MCLKVKNKRANINKRIKRNLNYLINKKRFYSDLIHNCDLKERESSTTITHTEFTTTRTTTKTTIKYPFQHHNHRSHHHSN